MNPATAAPAAELLRTDEYVHLLSLVPHDLVVDMDDTLNVNFPLFDASIEALLDVYQTLTGRADRDTLRAEHGKLDHSLVPELGYTPLRWFTSARRAGEMFLGRELTRLEDCQIRRAADVAMGYGDLYPGVAEALGALRASGLRAILKTKGETAKQQEKIDAHRFTDTFDVIEIVAKKDTASFADLAARHALRDPISIGDRYGADIQPALQAGYAHGIVVGDTPDWEQTGKDAPEHVDCVPSFADALVLLADRHR